MTHTLAFNPDAVTHHLAWLTLRYGVNVNLHFAPLILRLSKERPATAIRSPLSGVL